jgi:hypothetical protein
MAVETRHAEKTMLYELLKLKRINDKLCVRIRNEKKKKNSVRISCFRSASFFFYVPCIPVSVEITNTMTQCRTVTARN